MVCSTTKLLVLSLTALTVMASTNPGCVPPCGPGEYCVYDPTVNGGRCKCLLGTTGPHCNDTDPCAGHPCEHSGTCLAQPATHDYKCHCLHGFTGSRCQTGLSSCASNPCEHGQCQDHGTFFTCQCDPGYKGRTCQTKADICDSSPCSQYDHNARCRSDPVGITCSCSSDDYYGLLCEGTQPHCQRQEESYCICSVEQKPVKFSLPTPTPYSGVDSKDVEASMVGVLMGWLLGSGLLALYHFCCLTNSAVLPWKQGQKQWARPSTTSTQQTLSSGVSDRSLPVTLTQVQPMTNTPRPAESLTTNVYRAGFVDDLSHGVSNRKSPTTYTSGSPDW